METADHGLAMLGGKGEKTAARLPGRCAGRKGMMAENMDWKPVSSECRGRANAARSEGLAGNLGSCR